MPIKKADRARGARIERQFQDWLDRDGVPYFFFDQTTFTVPDQFRGLIKRPDFAVGIPDVGLVAFDVKAKTMLFGSFIIDLEEHQKLALFERCFNVVVWYAVFPPSRAPYCYLFRNRDLAAGVTYSLAGKPCLRFRQDKAIRVDHSKTALLMAVLGGRL